MKSRAISFLVLIAALLLAACGPAPASATEPPADTPLPPTETQPPTATATAVPPTPTPLPTTNIVIDGKADDWANYPVNITDPAGDQTPGMADLIEARYFMNDKYLYLLIKIENSDKWDDMAFAVGFPAKINGQLNIRPNHHVNAGFYGSEFVDLPVEMEAGEFIEVKILLDQFPAKLQGIYDIAVYNHNQSGGDPVDDSQNGKVQPIKVLKELEPTPPAGFGPEPAPTRVEFAAEDGHALIGYFYPSWQENAPVVVLVHQYGLPQENWANYGMVDWLQNWPPTGQAHGLFPAMPVDQSFAVFTLDLRGFGESGPAIPDSVSDEEFKVWGAGWVMDVKAALNQAKSMPGVDPSRVVIIGANNGADASIAACEGCLGVLALSAGGYAGLDTKNNAERLDSQGVVVWCVSTEKSAGSDVATCGSINGTKYKWVNFPGDGRGMQLIRDDKAPEGIGQGILDFLAIAFGF